MNALRLSAAPRRVLVAETSRAAAAWTSPRRALHADAPFLFSLPSDPEASMARTGAAPKAQHATTTPTASASTSAQRPQAATSPQPPRAHPDAPYILSVPPEFDHFSSSGGGAARGGEQMRA
ncbi:hypothetical protein GGTG_12642 [Gaeumannomyces tritici R3-111a-1]|uniref:Uncharacterized protein n=1 Tax=Gaeumannomyces tritici (strain R3-111a-1) TaxID=644352 RepID=J3PGL3_GAET3|nr:hypothetical protein GGTG_12642 [Gaeumannomyces tritici R3-111a-1]EJT69759.1 hypothetical protein GGTG_12642 [Gaeumannomyces tritici R3-111a-1]